MRPSARLVLSLGFAALCCAPGRVHAASACFQDGWDSGTIQSMTIFPNWTKVHVSSEVLWMFAGVAGPENITGVTICNLGTAVNTDLTGVYVVFSCGATTSGTLTLTYRGTYLEDSGSLPAWTWGGSTVDFSGCADLCGNPACGGSLNADIYVDVAGCPANGATVRMGFPTAGGFAIGSVSDSKGCQAPSGDAVGPDHTIQYVFKDGPTTAVPGDTVQFTLFYGRPGAGSLTSITIGDTLPPYTHYVGGSATPAPDAGFDPDWGPPIRLQWTFGGPLATAGGPTGQITFSLSVDWGNGETFEPGSGDVAAPEGARLANVATGAFAGATCPYMPSNTAQTVTKRFMLWIIGDNDVLFSPSYGQPPDEMIYSIFVKNLSTTKTWWDVRIWDTVPPVLDPWCAGCGFDDPCAGWTMTPGGCAAATPGRLTNGGNTILTWRLDMPPQFTIALRWKSQVRGATTAGATAINIMSLQEYGRTNIVNGTGNSGLVANFAHLAPIILPTTYISYVAYAGDRWAQPDDGDALSMFPLNRKTQFELRSLDYVAGWAGTGGPSASIGCLLGDCIGGFPGNGGLCPAGGIGSGPTTVAGCKAERIPARYAHLVAGGTPYQHLYKITSNSPVDWQSQPTLGSQCGDFHTYAPSNTLSYVGLGHYFWKNSYNATIQGSGTEMFFINTGKDPYGGVDTSLPTTVHVFQFNYGSLSWDYRTTFDLAGESGASWPTTTLGQEGAYRSISSQCQLVVHQGYQFLSTLGCGCPCFNDSSMMPVRESGNVVGLAGETFYGVAQGYGNLTKESIGNLGVVDAMYRVWLYIPDTVVGPAEIPINMRGSSGTWRLQGTHVVPWGYATALNPRLYNSDGTFFDASSTAMFKVELVSGGPIQIHHGARPFAGWGGGSVVHADTGAQTGSVFWVNQIFNDGTIGDSPPIYSIDVFCPAKGMVIQCEKEGLATVTYTTTGPDQCVAFTDPDLGEPGRKRNIRITRLGSGTPGDVICQYINAGPEKGYTAPFLQTGVHYAIILPATVFSGQSFWMTVLVLQQGGATKTDYCGTTSFTSTDPATKIENTAMQSYDYTWPSSIGAGCNGGAAVNGVKLFFNVTLYKLGLQSIIGIDTIDGSISGVAATMVVGADIKLVKTPSLTVGASGDIVQFRVCWSNFSSASGFTFVITDAVPVGTTFLPEAGTAAFDCGNTRGVLPLVAYSTAASVTPPAMTDGNPVAASRWLRFTIPQAGVYTTGCVCYRVTVN